MIFKNLRLIIGRAVRFRADKNFEIGGQFRADRKKSLIQRVSAGSSGQTGKNHLFRGFRRAVPGRPEKITYSEGFGGQFRASKIKL
jgi:hypothetical protein